MTNRSSRAWVKTKNTARPAVRLSSTIDSDPPSAACRVTASGYCSNNCRQASNDVVPDRASTVIAPTPSKREVHGLTPGGAVEAPLVGQGGHQDQARTDLRGGRDARLGRPGAGGPVHVNAQLTVAAAHGEGNAAARRPPDRVGHQVAGEQDRDVRVNRGLPGPDGLSHLPACFGHRGWSRGQPDTASVPFGGTGRRHGVHWLSFVAGCC